MHFLLLCHCGNTPNTAAVATAGQNDGQLRARVVHRLNGFPSWAGDGKPRKCGGVKDRGGEREETEPCQGEKKSSEPEVSDNVRRRGRNGILEKCEAAGWEAEMEMAPPRPVRRTGMK